jgi:23S rRNA (guanine745-N1)-methyltransferase
VCGDRLALSGRSWACVVGHSYDVAREGYVNLTRGGRLASAATPGDGAAAYAARRAVFAAGLYDEVQAAAAAAVAAAARRWGEERGGGAVPTVLDAGCGEGAYTAAVAAALPPAATVLGIDISRDAVRLAARAHGARASFAVASSFAAPLADASLAAALVAFAPVPWAELARVLDGGGASVVVVRPGPDHLDGFKAAIYGAAATPRALPPPPAAARVRKRLELPGELAASLLAMTPYAWRASEAATAAVAADGVDTWLDVVVETVPRGVVVGGRG